MSELIDRMLISKSHSHLTAELGVAVERISNIAYLSNAAKILAYADNKCPTFGNF